MLAIATITVLFVALSGLMALVESALLSISYGEVEELNVQQVWGAKALKTLVGRIARPVVVVVVFTNLINVLGPILVSRRAIELYGDSAIVSITVILTLATIVFSEIIPKSLGTHYATQIAPRAAIPIRALIVVLYPLVVLLEWFSDLLKHGKRKLGTEIQIRSLVAAGSRAGLIEQDEGRMIRRAFVLNDKTAADIMTPLSEVVAFDASVTVGRAATQVLEHAYSRYPVFGNSIHDIKGVVLNRDILEALAADKDDLAISAISHPSPTVPASLRSDALLARFRDQHMHLAVVRDGDRTIGVVTLEDVLEELVGEIEDEKDKTRLSSTS